MIPKKMTDSELQELVAQWVAETETAFTGEGCTFYIISTDGELEID